MIMVRAATSRSYFIFPLCVAFLNNSSLTAGVSHGDELSLLFAMPGIFTVTRNKADPDSNSVYHFSKDLVKLWVDFASKE